MAKLKEKAFWIVVGDVAGRGFSFLTSIYLARTLGSEFYGLITIAISILGYATWFSDLGLISIGTRETAKEPSKRIFRVLEVFRMKLFLGIAVLAGSTLLVSMIEMGDIEKQVILGYLYSIIPYMALMEWFYAGKQQFGKIAASKFLNGIIYFLLVVLMVSSAEDVTLVPVLYAAGVSTAALTLGTFAIRDKPFALPSRGFQIYPDLLKTSSILGLGKFFARVVELLPPLLIGALLSLKEAGLYGAAFRIVLIAMMIDRVFVNLLLPNLSSLWTTNRSLAARRMDAVFKLVTVAGVLLALIFAIAAEQLILWLYGAEYAGSVVILQLLSIMIAATFINSLFSFGLIATNKDREYFIATCFGGTLSAFIIFTFTAFGNVHLVAASVFISEIIISLFTYYWFRQVMPVRIKKPFFISVITASILFAISWISPLPTLVNAALATVIYIGVIVKGNVIEREQWHWAFQKIKKG